MGAAQSPYDTLSVGKDATPEQIRRAFRASVKKDHPDNDGAGGQITTLKFARDVLLDPSARQRFDETGELPNSEPDTLETKAMTFALQTVQTVLDAIEKRGGRITEFDVLKDCRKALADNGAQLDKLEADLKAKSAKLRKTAALFKAKRGKANLISPMLISQAVQAEEQLRGVAPDRAMLKRATAILDDHTFNWSAPAPGASSPLSSGPRAPAWFSGYAP